MKKFTIVFLLVLLTGGRLFAQTAPQWQEMKNFHSYMSSTFHPAEEGNFVPLRSKADSMLKSASLWQVSPIPANYKPVETKTTLAELVKQLSDIKQAVDRKASDDELKSLITEAHNIFHKIVGECKISEK